MFRYSFDKKKGLILCDYNSLNDLVDNKLICYDYCYDKKIRVGESIKIRIYYEYNKQPHLMWSSTLAFLFEDQNHNYWEQPFFYEKDNVYAPYEISYKELKKAVTTDDAYECFEHPWLWWKKYNIILKLKSRIFMTYYIFYFKLRLLKKT